MQLITAIIQPFMLDRLARALRKQAIMGYTATKVELSGQNPQDAPSYLESRIKIEIPVSDELADSITELILTTVGTQQESDGIVYVTPLLDARDIQTGKRGPDTLRMRRPERS